MPRKLASRPIELFYSYAHKDERLRDQLETHLALLKREGVIGTWHDRKIGAGTEWEGQIDVHLNTADVILLLISADFLASHYCYDIEMMRALERHEAGAARVIPVILRPVDWHGAPFGKLQALPADGKAVTRWTNRDQAWVNVVEGIRAAVRLMRPRPSAKTVTTLEPRRSARDHSSQRASPSGESTGLVEPKPQRRSGLKNTARNSTQGVRATSRTPIGDGPVTPRGRPRAVPAPPRRASDVVSTSGRLVMLDDGYFVAKTVLEKSDHSAVLSIGPKNSEEEAALRALRQERNRSSRTIAFAYQNLGWPATVISVESESRSGATTYEVVLKPSDYQQSTFPEMTVNNYSPDEIAELRARLLLLGEVPTRDRHDNLGLVWSFITGQGDLRREHGLFAELWSRLRLPAKDFLPRARLAAVYQLLVTRTVEHVLELRLGPVQRTTMPVRFRGRRHQPYTNRPAVLITIEGQCQLGARH